MKATNDPTISIIIPFYNSESYVTKCLDSLLSQSFVDFEIIAIDDGSEDNTFLKLKEYSNKDDRIICIIQKNQGRSAARNAGLKKAVGKYITFVDSDDFVSSTYLQNLIDGINYGVDIAMVDILTVDVEGMPLKKRNMYSNSVTVVGNKDSIQRVLHQKPGNEICGKLFKKELFEKLEFPVGKIYEDLYMTFALMCNAKEVAFIDSPDYFYVQRNDNTMNSEFTPKNIDILEMGEKAKRTILNEYPELEKDISSRLFAAYSNVWMKVKKRRNKKEYQLLWSEIKKIRSEIIFTKINNKNVFFGVYASLLGTRVYRYIYKLVRA